MALSRRQRAEGDSIAANAATDEGNGGKQQGESGLLDLTTAEQRVVDQLQQRDRDVKTHELAHLASASQYARGGPTYSYQTGPDGRRYAVGGEVAIDLGKEQTPEQTAEKMRLVKRAAMAPAEPSTTDRRIAATATAIEMEARREMQNDRRPDNPKKSEPATGQQSNGGEQADRSDVGTTDGGLSPSSLA